MSPQVYRSFTRETRTRRTKFRYGSLTAAVGVCASRMKGMWSRTDEPGDAPDGGTVSVLEPETTDVSVEEGDHERFSHYVQKEKILESAVTGQPVIALCGKVWTPGRDPEKFPVCPTCKDIYESLRDD